MAYSRSGSNQGSSADSGLGESGASSPSQVLGDSSVEGKKQSKFRLGLLAKTTFILLVVGIGPLIAFGLFTLAQQRANLGEQAERSMQTNAEYISANVDEWFDKNVRTMRAAVLMPSITGMVPADQSKVLLAIKQAYPWMYLVFTIGLDGKNIARSDDQPLVDYSERQYYKDIVSGGKDLSWETVIGKTSGKPSLLVSIPIRVNGQLVGVFAAGMTIAEISQSVANWKSGETGFAFMVDEKSKVLAHPQKDYVLTQKRLADQPMVATYHADNKPHLRAFLDNGKPTLGYVQGNKSGWAIVVQQSQDELYAPLRSTVTIGLLLLLAAVIVVIILGLVSSRMLVRPIVEMTNAADRMSMGELQNPIRVGGNDELSVLAKSLERLRKSMRAAMARIARDSGG